MIKFLKLHAPSYLVCRSSKALSCFRGHSRLFSDTAHSDLTPSNKQVVQVYGTENEQRVRVRRARSSDVPRVLRFVREHSRTAWPSLMSNPVAPTSASQLILADYVARALAQGHSMLAEQISSRRGWLTVRGLALGTAVCPWDAQVLERWATCLRDSRSRRLVNFSAHCLRAPALHDKYGVHKIMQVILILSPDAQNNMEIVQMLAKSAIQRGRDVGFPMLRFDVTNDTVAKALEGLQLKKEWQLNYEVLPTETAMQETMEGSGSSVDSKLKKESEGFTESLGTTTEGGERKGYFIAVYSALTASKPESAPTSTAPTSTTPTSSTLNTSTPNPATPNPTTPNPTSPPPANPTPAATDDSTKPAPVAS